MAATMRVNTWYTFSKGTQFHVLKFSFVYMKEGGGSIHTKDSSYLIEILKKLLNFIYIRVSIFLYEVGRGGIHTKTAAHVKRTSGKHS